MTRTATYTCDGCQKAVVSEQLPFDWRTASLQCKDADLRGDYSADLCSPACAAAWIERRFKGDLNP